MAPRGGRFYVFQGSEPVDVFQDDADDLLRLNPRMFKVAPPDEPGAVQVLTVEETEKPEAVQASPRRGGRRKRNAE